MQLLIGHRAVGGAEVNRSRKQLPNAAAGPDGLVIDFNLGMISMIFVKPL